jgi:hypothetical protein
MHPKWILLSSIFNFFFFFAVAQETPNNYAAFDWSFSFFNSQPADIDRIRGGVASFHAENSNKGLASISFRGTTGIKYEALRINNRISLLAGIRFSEFVQNTGKWDLLTEGPNYFYFLYRQDDQNTYYARVHSILQTSSYLGLPVEFSFFPIETYHYCRFYIKMGAEIDFRLGTHTNINFKSDGFEFMEAQVAAQVSKPSVIGFSIYNCVGVRAGAVGKANFSLELLIPVLNTNPGSSGLLKNRFGTGLQFSYYIPIQSRNP